MAAVTKGEELIAAFALGAGIGDTEPIPFEVDEMWAAIGELGDSREENLLNAFRRGYLFTGDLSDSEVDVLKNSVDRKLATGLIEATIRVRETF